MHTQDHDDAKCEILTNTMVYDWKDPKYPSEWTYDEKDKPCCTAFKKWDWVYKNLSEILFANRQ